MTLDPETVRRLHDEWAASQPDDAPTFDGPDGNQFFADDEAFWEATEAEERKARN